MNDKELICVVCGKKVKINKYQGNDPYTCFKCRPKKEINEDK